MLLIVGNEPEEVEAMRKKFEKNYFFTFATVYRYLYSQAVNNNVDVILFLSPPKNDDLILNAMKKVRRKLPNVTVMIRAKAGTSDFPEYAPKRIFTLHTHMQTIILNVLWSTPRKENESIVHGNIIIKGLFMDIVFGDVTLYGQRINFTRSEIYMLRYLAEIYPRSAGIKEIGRVCFPFRRNPGRSTIASRICRLNQKAYPRLRRPLIAHIYPATYTLGI